MEETRSPSGHSFPSGADPSVEPNAKRTRLEQGPEASGSAEIGGVRVFDRPDPSGAHAQRVRRIAALVALVAAIVLGILLIMQSTHAVRS